MIVPVKDFLIIIYALCSQHYWYLILFFSLLSLCINMRLYISPLWKYEWSTDLEVNSTECNIRDNAQKKKKHHPNKNNQTIKWWNKRKHMWLDYKNMNWQEDETKNKGDELRWWAASVHRRQVRGEVVFFFMAVGTNGRKGALSLPPHLLQFAFTCQPGGLALGRISSLLF